MRPKDADDKHAEWDGLSHYDAGYGYSAGTYGKNPRKTMLCLDAFGVIRYQMARIAARPVTETRFCLCFYLSWQVVPAENRSER
ncbi:MAG: hypothetical protein ACR2O0_15620 [Rhizobiaceae bacterium]